VNQLESLDEKDYQQGPLLFDNGTSFAGHVSRICHRVVQCPTISHMDELRPLAKPGKVALMQALRGSSLTLSAAEALLGAAEILSEGEVAPVAAKEYCYSGSTLVSIDLAGKFHFGGKQNLQTLLTCVKRSIPFRLGLMRLARGEAERRCAPRLVREIEMETEFRIDGAQLLVDIDVECPLAASSDLEGEG
jgi:hypothetical protein